MIMTEKQADLEVRQAVANHELEGGKVDAYIQELGKDFLTGKITQEEMHQKKEAYLFEKFPHLKKKAIA